MMFGDVGGLNDFLGLLISPVFEFFSGYLLNGEMVKKMFHSISTASNGNLTKHSPGAANSMKTFSSIKPIKLRPFSKCFAPVLLVSVQGTNRGQDISKLALVSSTTP